MLTQDFVLSILQASITGAGLVLAVYALVSPLSRRLFEYRAKVVAEAIDKLKKKVEKQKITTFDKKELQNLMDKIEELQPFPTYLKWWVVALSFFFYVISALMSVSWILDTNRLAIDEWLPRAFVFSTLVFLLVGLFVIYDIFKLMKREYEEAKEEIEELKSRVDISVEM